MSGAWPVVAKPSACLVFLCPSINLDNVSRHTRCSIIDHRHDGGQHGGRDENQKGKYGIRGLGEWRLWKGRASMRCGAVANDAGDRRIAVRIMGAEEMGQNKRCNMEDGMGAGSRRHANQVASTMNA